jgi:hypothetical protein
MRSRASGYLLILIALAAAAVALFFGYHGARLIYFAAIFGGRGPQGVDIALGFFSYVTVLTAAVIFPLIAILAALIACLCWGVGLGMMKRQ